MVAENFSKTVPGGSVSYISSDMDLGERTKEKLMIEFIVLKYICLNP